MLIHVVAKRVQTTSLTALHRGWEEEEEEEEEGGDHHQSKGGMRGPHLAIVHGFPRVSHPILTNDGAKHGLTQAKVGSRKGRCTMGCDACRRPVGWPGQPNSHPKVRQRGQPSLLQRMRIEDRGAHHHLRAPQRRGEEGQPPAEGSANILTGLIRNREEHRVESEDIDVPVSHSEALDH